MFKKPQHLRIYKLPIAMRLAFVTEKTSLVDPLAEEEALLGVWCDTAFDASGDLVFFAKRGRCEVDIRRVIKKLPILRDHAAQLRKAAGL